jgi:hypothetical protein
MYRGIAKYRGIAMKSRLLVTCASSLMLLLALSGQARADAITITYSEDTASFSLFVESTLGINGEDTHSLNGGSDWRLSIDIDEHENENSTEFGDSMVIVGDIRHINAPHGEPPNPNRYIFAEAIFARRPGMHTRTFRPAHLSHPALGHFNDYEARLEFVTAPRPRGDKFDITKWTFIVKGIHTEGSLALPEPSTLALLVLGILALPLLRRLNPHT